MNTILSWLQYHTITAIKRRYAHRTYLERRYVLNNLIRVVITFDEPTGKTNACIKYRDFVITELHNGAIEHANDLLKVLRRLNRHTII